MRSKAIQERKVKIGLEIHGYILTKEKLFCECKTDYKNSKPNTNICPICTAQPGCKPMLPNSEALKKILEIALVLGCKISEKPLIWQRKHYDWPDLPKGYQDTISGAYSIPIGYEGEFVGIRISDVHLEEDPARWDPETGYIDYNRCGLPLIEIVTEPDFRSAKEVREWLQQLVITLSYVKAFDKDAGIKADVNISIEGSERVEIKNINSLYNIVRALEYEEARQKSALSKGDKIKRETRAFDEKKKITIVMREKEQTEDYRFIPDPDLPTIRIDKNMIDKIKKELPELPHFKVDRFIKEGIEQKAAKVLSQNKEIVEFYEEIVKLGANKKLASYWVTIELLRILNYNKKNLNEVDIKTKHFAELLKLIEEGKLTELAAKKMLNNFIPKSFSPKSKLKGIEKISNEKEIEKIVKKVIESKEAKEAIISYKTGGEKALNFLIGMVMKETKGRADYRLVKNILLKILK